MLVWLIRNPFFGVMLAGILVLAGLAAREFARPPAPAPIILNTSSALEGEPIRVHIAGAVAVPGVYDLLGGDRVEDAIIVAGGALEGADLNGINLARRLRDGEQLLVPGASERQSPIVALQPGELLDLNQATREQLMALPGIGEAYSRRIIDSRTIDGQFASIDEILERSLVPARTLEGIRPLITVTQP